MSAPMPFCLAASESVVTELRFLPEGWWAVAGLALLVVLLWSVGWMYKTEGRVGASPRRRALLAVLRSLVLIALALIFLEPVRVHILRKRIESYTVVLLDQSSSMSLRDSYRDPQRRDQLQSALGIADPAAASRAELASAILNKDNRAFLRGLAENNRVSIAAFADDLQPLGGIRAAYEDAASTASSDESETPASLAGDASSLTLPSSAAGPATNIEKALHRAIEPLAGAPVAAVIVFSDGGFNQGASAEQAARYAREKRIPLHTVAVGDPSPPRNARVVEVTAPPNAFKEDPFAVTATIAAQGLDGEQIRVQLSESTAASTQPGIIETRSVTVRPGGAIDPIVFERRVEATGRMTYTVEVLPVEDETVADDNARQTAVNIIDSKTKVLLVSGGPSWDYRYVSTLLQRDETIEVACWLQSADATAVRDGDVLIDHLPATPEELFAYDVILLLDPDKDEFDESWAQLADQFVSRQGGGLLYAAARPHTPAFMRERPLKPLHDLLPIVLDPEADLVLNQIGHYQTTPSPIEVPQPAYSHSILRMADDVASTRLVWQGVGDVFWHYPVLREKPVATVLMRHGGPRMKNSFGPHVLSAVQFVGPGRTAWLGFDTSWRWRRVGEEMYGRFWIQMVRFLSEGKLLGQSRRGNLTVENENPVLGQTVVVHARLLSPRFEPLDRRQVSARVEFEGQSRELILTAVPDQPGMFEGQFLPDRTGAYRISLTLQDGNDKEPVELQRDLIVSRPDLEMVSPQLNREALMTLAEQSHGGKYWEIHEASAIPTLIPDVHEEIAVRSRPKTIWDNSVTLSILLGLLILEWALRKWSRLL